MSGHEWMILLDDIEQYQKDMNNPMKALDMTTEEYHEFIDDIEQYQKDKK